MRKTKKAESTEGYSQARELLRAGDLVQYDMNYDDMFDIHTGRTSDEEVGMVTEIIEPRRRICVKWQRSGVHGEYIRAELVILSRV